MITDKGLRKNQLKREQPKKISTTKNWDADKMKRVVTGLLMAMGIERQVLTAGANDSQGNTPPKF